MKYEWVKTPNGKVRREIQPDKCRREVYYEERRMPDGHIERVRVEVRK